MPVVSEIAVRLPHNALRHADWADAWQTQISRPFDNARKAAEAVGRNFPKWTWPMLVLRQILVLPFGLKGSGQKNDRVSIFPVVSETGEQIVAGFDDRHLDFRIVVDVASAGTAPDFQTVTLTTVIRRHNLLGRLYLAAVLPFHRAIIASALKRIARQQS